MALSLLVVLCGCYTEKRAAKDVVRAHVEYPNITAGYCGKWYPIRIYDSTRIEYRPGDVKYIPGDTVVVDCDTAKTKIVKVPCPPQIVRVDTLYFSSDKQAENTAVSDTYKLAYEREREASNAKDAVIAKQKKANDIAIWALIILGVYTIGRWVLRVWGIKIP